MNKQGKFIVLYGINNLGKTTQAERLTNNLNSKGIKTEQIKYPFYTIQPTGSIIYDYLRSGNPFELTPTEIQIMYAYNKTQYAPTLEKKLAGNVNVVAEDYVATSIAWGTGAGVKRELIEKMNDHLRTPDIGILLDGKRFMKSVEKGHTHEENDSLTKKVRTIHQELAKENDWRVIDANQSRDMVEEAIFNEVKKRLE